MIAQRQMRQKAPSRKHPLYSINVIPIPLAIVENIDQ